MPKNKRVNHDNVVYLNPTKVSHKQAREIYKILLIVSVTLNLILIFIK